MTTTLSLASVGSRLRSAMRSSVRGNKIFPKVDLATQTKADLCASFEAAVVDVLASKCERAVKQYRCQRLIVGGGVAANSYLRQRLNKSAATHGYDLTIAPMNLCTDNAVMGAIAFEKMKRGEFASLDLDITPGLQRGF